jgi:hypothetical protein
MRANGLKIRRFTSLEKLSTQYLKKAHSKALKQLNFNRPYFQLVMSFMTLNF